jgi:hypothetical protein
MLLTQQRYEVAGGSLTLLLRTDHALSARERQALDRLTLACSDYAREAPPADGDDPFDLALEELGGAENICAG